MPPEVPTAITKLYDLILWLLQQVPKFPRSHRFVLGERIEGLALDVLDLLIEAAYTREKRGLLRRAVLGLEKLRYLVRLSRDLSFLSSRRYEFAAGRIDEIGRMVGGWLRQQERR
ncbi:MAG: diversity-generating retroelement protein Avd [Gemmatimonadota bacterium]